MQTKTYAADIEISRGERDALRDAGILGVRNANTMAAAQFLGVTPGTLRNWRAADEGPRFEKIGRTGFYVRYSVVDLVAFKRKLEPAG